MGKVYKCVFETGCDWNASEKYWNVQENIREAHQVGYISLIVCVEKICITFYLLDEWSWVLNLANISRPNCNQISKRRFSDFFVVVAIDWFIKANSHACLNQTIYLPSSWPHTVIALHLL